MLGYHLFQTKGSSSSCEEPTWLRSKFHNQKCNRSFKVFKISRIELEDSWSRLYVEQTSKLDIGYMFLKKKACGSRQTSVQVTWMGNFF
jgi:hypothetical protein